MSFQVSGVQNTVNIVISGISDPLFRDLESKLIDEINSLEKKIAKRVMRDILAQVQTCQTCHRKILPGD